MSPRDPSAVAQYLRFPATVSLLYWDKSLEGTCYPVSLFVQFGLANTAFNIFTDVAFATLPIPIIWNLKMHLKTRLYLIGVLSLGYLAVVMGILKGIAQIDFNPLGDAATL